MPESAVSPQSNPPPPKPPQATKAAVSLRPSPAKRNVLGIYLLVAPLVLAYVVFALWPVDQPPAEGATESAGWARNAPLLGIDAASIPDDSRLLLIVILVGALGSYVHAATSFASYAGNETLRLSWLWWYLLRPFVGMALALIFYFVLRGGLLTSADSDAEVISLYGMAAVAGLVGMFSKQATDKLNETFTALFRTSRGEGDDARSDKLHQHESVRNVMIPYDKIEKVVLDENETDESIGLGRLVDMLGPTVTRIPIFHADGRAKYVVHEGLLYRFVTQRTRRKEGFDLDAATLKSFLDEEENRGLVEALAFVTAESTLADARKAMEKIEHCRDAFVTETGAEAGKVVGWLTNVDIAKRSGR